MSPTKDYFTLHFIVLIWGFTAILGLLISIPAVELVFYRTLFAALLLGMLLKFRKISFALNPVDYLKITGTGALIAAHWILFFEAARVSNASVCLAGMATCSLWTSVLEPLASNKKIRLFEVFLGLVVIGGLYIIFRFEFDHALGLTLAVISALLAAIFTVINSKFAQRHNPYRITFYEMAGANIAIVLFFPFYGKFGNGLNLIPVGLDWLYIFLLASVCTVYAYSVSVELMKRLSAFVVNLTVNLEPVYGIILALIIFGEKEKMGEGFYLGTAVILLSVLAYPPLNRYYKRKAMSTDNLR